MTAGRPAAWRRWLPTHWSVWGRWLAVWTLIGLIIRIASVLGRPHRTAGGDVFFYHGAANLLVDGKGFINPFLYYGHQHTSVASAAFPPGFVLVLAAASLVGFKSYFAHRIWCCLIGAAAVAVCGRTAREISGPRVGLITAFIVAVYPNIWMSDEIGMSETLSPLLVALVLLAAYRFWRNPGVREAAWLGAAVGVAALVRDELALLGIFILVPMVLTAKALSWRKRGVALAAGAFCALGVIAPWVGYNLTRFQDPVLISTGLGPTLASTNCGLTYSGQLEGYWSMQCALEAAPKYPADESVRDSVERTYAVRFIRSHLGRLVPVNLARLGRAFGIFHPIEQVQLDSTIETRPYHWALAGLGMYYGLALLSIGGAVLLRARRIPIFPLVGVGLTVVVSTLLSFGDTRYRTTFEVVLALLGAVVVEWAWARLRPANEAPDLNRSARVHSLQPVLPGR